MDQVVRYLKWLWRSKNKHAVHSPFVFKLLTEGIAKKAYSTYRALQDHTWYLTRQNYSINVEDFGAGSRKFKSNERKVRAIARVAGMPRAQQRLMATVTSYFKPKQMLELGTSIGKGSAAMHLGYPEGKLTTVERCPDTLAEAEKGFEYCNFRNIETVNALFTDFLNEDARSWDLVYLDGGHTKDFTLFTFEQLLPKLHNDSLLIIDDIYWSPQMMEAWEEIKQHPKVTVTIDSFHWGWVFFRKEQEKQHFVLRM